MTVNRCDNLPHLQDCHSVVIYKKSCKQNIFPPRLYFCVPWSFSPLLRNWALWIRGDFFLVFPTCKISLYPHALFWPLRIPPKAMVSLADYPHHCDPQYYMLLCQFYMSWYIFPPHLKCQFRHRQEGINKISRQWRYFIWSWNYCWPWARKYIPDEQNRK